MAAEQITKREYAKKTGIPFEELTLRVIDRDTLTYEVLHGTTPIAVVDYVGKRRGYYRTLATGAEEIARYKQPKEERYNAAKTAAAEQFGVDPNSISVSGLHNIRQASNEGDFEVTGADGILGVINYNYSTGKSNIRGRGKYAATNLRNRQLDQREAQSSFRAPNTTPSGQPPAQGTGVSADGAGQEPYIIQQGDTLSQIAATYNTTIDELMRLNPTIKDENLIYAGNPLVLPTQAQETQQSVVQTVGQQPQQPYTNPVQLPNQPTTQPYGQQQGTQQGQPALPGMGQRPMQPTIGGMQGGLLDGYFTATAQALQQAMAGGANIQKAFDDMYNPENLEKSGVLEEMNGVADLDKNTKAMQDSNPLKTMAIDAKTIADENTKADQIRNAEKAIKDNTEGYEAAVEAERSEWIQSLRNQPMNIYSNPAINKTYVEIADLYAELSAIKDAGSVVREYIREKGRGELSFSFLNNLTIVKSREVDAEITRVQRNIDFATRILNAQLQLQERADKLIRADRQFYADEQNRLRDDMLAGARTQQDQYEFEERKWQADRAFLMDAYNTQQDRMDDRQRTAFNQKIAEYDRTFRLYQQKRDEYEYAQDQPLRAKKLELELSKLQADIENFPIEQLLKSSKLEYDKDLLAFRYDELDYKTANIGKTSKEKDDFATRAARNYTKNDQAAIGRKLLSLSDEALTSVAQQLGIESTKGHWAPFGIGDRTKEDVVKEIVARIAGNEAMIRSIINL